MHMWDPLPRVAFAGAALLALTLGGCAANSDHPGEATKLEDQSAANRWMVDSIRDAAINNALITQHTLYPYHFLPGSAELNDLGRRDLGALAVYYRTTPGDLNVRRADTPDDIYRARVNTVSKALAAAGVDTRRIRIADGPAGGPGIPSERMIVILAKDANAGNWNSDYNGVSGGSAGSGASSGSSPSTGVNP